MKRFLLATMVLCLLLCVCGCNNFNEQNQHAHNFNVEIISSTCSKEGYTLYTCTTCGFKTMGDFTPVLQNGGHDYDNCVCTECGDFLKGEAIDSISLKYVKTIDENGNEVYCVTGVTDECEYIKVPSTYNGLPVTRIADEAFYNLLTLKHVVLPDSIVSIGNSAYKHCFNLISIDIPDSVTSIGREAFMNCQKLKSISLGNITKINEATLIGCSSIIDVKIPKNVTTICAYAFDSCFNLTSVTIPKSVSVIRHAAFYNSYNLQDIFYEGTIEQWNTIDKEIGSFSNTNEDASWDAYINNYTIHCSDGNITKN